MGIGRCSNPDSLCAAGVALPNSDTSLEIVCRLESRFAESEVDSRGPATGHEERES